MTELMVALGMGLVTLLAVYSVHLFQVKQQTAQEDLLAMQQNARAAMDLMVRELRLAGYDPRGVNQDEKVANDFVGVEYHPSELHIQADLNGNGLIGEANEMIVYLHDQTSSTLRRKVGGGGRQPVAEHIQSFTIQYFDEKGILTTDSRKIREVELMVIAKTEHADSAYPSNDGHRFLTLRSRVWLRNQ